MEYRTVDHHKHPNLNTLKMYQVSSKCLLDTHNNDLFSFLSPLSSGYNACAEAQLR